ncbi:MAG: response regulator [Rickettsiales bacterium]|nr:response regulator [Rickettsiales bacterium]
MSEKTKAKILCVEDEQDIRENIAEVLRDEGFEVIEAGNGNKGFKQFLEYKPHLIISDIMMPELDGYGLLKKVREDKTSKNNNVPFIFLTALGQKDDIIKGVDMSANDYLIKPIDFDLMIAKAKEKTENSIKLQNLQNKKIDNIKNQFTSILPTNELFSYLDIITKVCEILKEEPYGPLRDNRYLEDFDKIHKNATKLRTSITNFIDKSTIETKLNANEEVISMSNFFENFINKLNEKYRKLITFNKPFEENTKARIDKASFVKATRKILSGLLRTDPNAKVEISTMFDQLNQMVIIFYLDSPDSELNLNEAMNLGEIKTILDEQNINIELSHNTKNTLTVYIPSFRLV